MEGSIFLLFVIPYQELSPLKLSHSRTKIFRVLTVLLLHLYLPLGVCGNPTGTRNQRNQWCQKLLDKHFLLRYECYSFSKQSRWNNRTSLWDLTVQTLILSQIVIGILGNFALLCHYFSLFHTHCRLKATDLILIHLILANFFLLCSKAVPKTIATLAWKKFTSNLRCHIHLYVNRVTRTVSIGTTCLLSVYQTIMISPINSWWKDLKVRAPNSVNYSTSLCWTLSMLVNLIFPIYTSAHCGNRDSMNGTYLQDSSLDHEEIVGLLYAALVAFPEVILSVLIFLSSGFMIFMLFRHKQQVQNIHRTHLSPRSSAVSRATQSILLLMITFLCFLTLSSLFTVSLALQQNPEMWLVNITEVISLGFPTVSPFLLLRQDSTLCRTFSTRIMIWKSSVLMRNM